MPLILPYYNLDGVEDWEALLVADAGGRTSLNEATALLINYLWVIGLPRLTADVAEDAWLRIAAHQAQLGSPFVDDQGKSCYLTRADVTRHIGLQTEGDYKPIDSFWRSLARRTDVEAELPFVRLNGGKSLLSLLGVDG